MTPIEMYAPAVMDASAASACELSIIMPCLDEAETIGACITKAQGYLARRGIAGEIVIADNGSTDGSQAIAGRLGARVVSVPTRGYGAALQAGIANARGRYVIMGDSDDSYDFSELDVFVAKLREGFELVMGNRFKGGIRPGAMPPLHRYLGNPVLSTIGRLLFSAPCQDFHCGLRGFSRDAIRALDLRTTGMEFASEMVVKAALHELKITEVPTVLSKDGRSRPSHLRSWHDGWRHLRFLLLYSPRWLFLYPGILLTLLGIALMAVVLPGPLELRGVEFDVQTLLVAMTATVLGTLCIGTFLLAKQFATNENLIPLGRNFAAFLRFNSLERAIVVGVVLVLLGGAGVIASISNWASVDFGRLDYRQSMRLLIPSLTALMCGAQVIVFGFASSILELKLRR